MNKMHKFLTIQLIVLLIAISGCTTLWPEHWHSMMYNSTEQTRASNEKIEVDSKWIAKLEFQEAINKGSVDYSDYSKWWTDRMGIESAKQSPPDIEIGGSISGTIKDSLSSLWTPEGLAMGAGGGSLVMLLLNMGIGYFRKRIAEKESEKVAIKVDAEKKALQDKIIESDKYVIELEGKVTALKKERDTLRGQLAAQVPQTIHSAKQEPGENAV